jgi:hypothetical protein
MTPRWLIAFAVVLALMFCGSALAGPKNPYWGDPEIFEGVRPKDRIIHEKVSGEGGLHLIVVDVPIYRKYIQVRHERTQRLDKVPILGRNSAASKRILIGP